MPDRQHLRTNDILKEMKSASDTNPLSLLNLDNSPPAVKIIDPQRVSDEAAKTRDPGKDTADAAAANTGAERAKSASGESAPVPTFFQEDTGDAERTGAAPAGDDKSAAPVLTDEEPEEIKELVDPSAENFKKVRTIVKETKKKAKELEAKNKELEDKLKTHVSMDVLVEKDREIQELSKYQKLHDLKGSTEYQEKYVAPISEKHQKLKEMFKDYGVPEEDIDEVVKRGTSLTNTAQLNHFLADHFGDQLGANEAKALITGIRTLETEAREAEKAPESVLQSLREHNAQLNQQREVQRREEISTAARSAWEESVLEIRQEGQIKELIHRDDDPEFNENYPEKLLKQAATEYGKLITEMAKDGAKPSKAVARALARMTLLSQTAGVAIVTRNRAMEEAETLTRNATRTNGLFRPTIGGGNRSAGGGQDNAAQSKAPPEDQLKSDVKNLVSSVLQKR